MDKAATLLDLFGVAPVINLNGKPKIYSFCGTLFTLSVIALTVLMAIYFSGDMINGKNPIVSQNLIHGALVDNMLDLDPNQFVMKFGLESGHTYKYYVDTSIYNVTARTWIAKDFLDPKAGCPQGWSLPLSVCEPKTGSGQLYCLTSRVPKQYRNCLINKTIENLFLIVNSQDIYIDFWKCNSNVSNCATSFPSGYSSLDEYLEGGYIVVERPDWNINTQNYTNPLSHVTRLERHALIADMYKYTRYDLGVLDMVTDDGWMMSSPRNESVIYIDSVASDLFSKSDYPNKFARISIISGGKKTMYSRKYQKVQDIVAQVNSMVTLCVVAAGLLALPFAKAKMYESVINGLYQVKIENGAKANRKKKKKTKAKEAVKNNAVNLKSPSKTAEITMFSMSPLRTELNLLKTEMSPLKTETGVTKEPKVFVFSNNTSMCKDDAPSLSQDPLASPTHGPLLSTLNRTNTQQTQASSQQQSLIALSTLLSSPAKVQNKQGEPKETKTLSPIDRVQSITTVRSNSGLVSLQTGISSPDIKKVTKENTKVKINEEVKEEKEEESEVSDSEKESEDQDEDNSEENSEEISLDVEDEPKPLRVSLLNFLKAFYDSDPKVKALGKGSAELRSQIDIITLINTKRELENLKWCLLSPHQRAVFENLRKPTLYIDARGKSKSPELLDFYESYKGNREKLQEAYGVLKESVGKDEVDKRLLMLYDSLREADPKRKKQ